MEMPMYDHGDVILNPGVTYENNDKRSLINFDSRVKWITVNWLLLSLKLSPVISGVIEVKWFV